MTTEMPNGVPTSQGTHRSSMVDALELRARLNGSSRPRVLDVRTPAEFETVHIPGAYNVPLDTLKEHREEISNHVDDDVVLVCRGGQRASQAGEALAGVGLANVQVLEGGMLAWERAGEPVNRGRQRWDLERQVRLVAGSMVLASVVASIFVPGLKWVAAFVGAGLSFAALSNTCAMGSLLSKLPYNRGATCDPQAVIGQLADSGKAT